MLILDIQHTLFSIALQREDKFDQQSFVCLFLTGDYPDRDPRLVAGDASEHRAFSVASSSIKGCRNLFCLSCFVALARTSALASAKYHEFVSIG